MASYKVMGSSWSSSAASTSGSENTKRGMSVNVYNFQTAIKKLLSKDEQEDITHILSCYHRNRNVYYLAESLKALLDTPEKKHVIPLLKQVIPKADRPSFDQFTCESTYIRRTASSRRSTFSHHQTDDSGIGTNSAAQSTLGQESHRSSNVRLNKAHRSSSMSALSHKSSEKSSKRFSAGTFGSAVRRKVKAALARRGSSSSVDLKSSVQRCHHSETDLNKVGRESEFKNKYSQRAGVTLSNDKLVRMRKTDRRGVVCVRLLRDKDEGFGFIIGGGVEVGSSIFVSQVEPGSPADASGLSKGDVILQVNDTLFNNDMSHEIAVAILSSLDRLSLYIRPAKAQTNMPRDLSWTDTHGRPASPPHSISRKNQYAKPILDSRKSSLHLLSAGERKVNLTVKPRQSLGLMIRGGSEYGLGIYVTGVDAMSAAENAGLKAGDEILEVNNVILEGASHAEAVSAIKSSQILIMTVRYVGRIPQNQHVVSPRMVDDRISLHSSVAGRSMHNSVSNHNGVRSKYKSKILSSKQMILPNMHSKSPSHNNAAKISSTLATLEEALLASPIWMSLADSERHSVRYYVKEYASGNITPDALVLALSELLDSHEKFALMSAVRECMLSTHLDRFDVLVLRREIDALRHRHQSQSSDNSLASTLSPTDCSNLTASSTNAQKSLTSSISNGVLDSADVNASSTHPKKHSTPKDSFKNSKNIQNDNTALSKAARLSLSPVRPAHNPPPPPFKNPPVKPKRSFRLNTSESPAESDNSSHSFAPVEEPLYSVIKKNATNDHRPASPFSLALEIQRSTNSGRIKASNKSPSHVAMPTADFFEDPKEKNRHVTTREPRYSSIIKPVKNPSIKLLKEQRRSHLDNMDKIATENLDNSTLPSSSTTSSSSSLSESSCGNVQAPPSSITLRSANFAATINDKVKSSCQYPVKADVHRQPSIIKQAESTNQYETTSKKSQFPMHDSSDDVSSSDESDAEKPAYLTNDVDTQKVVIFRTANTLGLTIEGGAGTRQPLPRVLQILPGSCAHMCGRVKVGHVIHEVNRKALEGLSHHDAVRTIALAFKQQDRDSIELVLSGPY